MNIKQLRSYRIFGIAMFDLIVAMLGLITLFLIAWKVHFQNLDWWKFALAGVLLAIPVGIFFHILFGTNTTLNYKLGLSNKPT